MNRSFESYNAGKTIEQKAQELVGQEWFSLDSKTKASLIADFVTEGVLSTFAKGSVVAKKFGVRYIMVSGNPIEKLYDSEDEMNEEIQSFYIENINDIQDVELFEPKVKEPKEPKGKKEEPKEEKPKKDIFALAGEEKKKAGVSKTYDVKVEGLEDEIEQYYDIVKNIKILEAEKDVVGGIIKDRGKEVFLELYEDKGSNPNNFNLVSGNAKILYMTKDAYPVVQQEKQELLSMYEGILDTTVEYKLNSETLDKPSEVKGKTNGEVLNDLIMDSDEISDKDKANLLKAVRKVSIKKGTIDMLNKYDNIEEVYNIIEPIVALNLIS